MNNVKQKNIENLVVTQNACKTCNPLGASLVFRGIEGGMPLVHGSQGCATYIRRYMISHFKEPIDIASSNFSENTAIFGGSSNLLLSIGNVIRQYQPQLLGIASTCLSETIGDDIAMIVKEYINSNADTKTEICHVSTPSYKGSHIDGFHASVKAVVNKISEGGTPLEAVNVLPGMLSPADLRYIKEVLDDFQLDSIMLPDYSESLDGGLWKEYEKIPKGGTPIDAIRSMGRAHATIEFGSGLDDVHTAGTLLHKRFGIKNYRTAIPVGVRENDTLFEIIEKISGEKTPLKYIKERDRLVDAYADAHKHLFGIKAAVFGDEDLVISMVSFLSEIGVVPAVCATGSKNALFKNKISQVVSEQYESEVTVIDNADFVEIGEIARQQNVDILVGNSKGYSISKKMDIPLIRVGFPIHDRIGGQRKLHVGYRGTQQLFDEIVNTIIETKQKKSSVGYTYM